ncbi:MAG: alpha/beta hydrolase, partial [Gemmiger sp.]
MTSDMWGLLLLGIAIFLTCWFAIRWWLSNLVLNPQPSHSLEESKKTQFALYGISDDDWDHNWHREEFRLQSQYGYPLACIYIPRPEEAVPKDGRERIAVIVHGHGVNHYNSVKYAAMFRSLGFHTVIYDNRNHGDSGKALTTMGYYESRDLCTVCQWVREKF